MEVEQMRLAAFSMDYSGFSMRDVQLDYESTNCDREMQDSLLSLALEAYDNFQNFWPATAGSYQKVTFSFFLPWFIIETLLLIVMQTANPSRNVFG